MACSVCGGLIKEMVEGVGSGWIGLHEKSTPG